jgi:peptidoglycan/xylan/chitin deacetylase (PgdA/CDA1 family)
LPVLRRHGAPFTVFVATDFADGTGRLWWVELEEALARLDRVAVTVGGERFAAPCRTPGEKAAAFAGLYRLVRSGPEEHLRATVALLAGEASLDPAAVTKTLCLGWDEIAALAREPGATIGAHTLSHPMLAKWPAAFARREIAESKAVIEGKLGRPVRHLAYPVGDPASAGPREFALAREAGFATAVTTRPGHLFPAHRPHLHALPRVSVNGLHQSEDALRALLSGVPFLAWNRGRRVNVA